MLSMSHSTAWPMIDPPLDGGKWIMGVFEGGARANGVTINCVSARTTAREIVDTLKTKSGCKVLLSNVSQEEFEKDYTKNIADQLTETLRIAGEYNIFGSGAENYQPAFDQWLVGGSTPKFTLEKLIHHHRPLKFAGTTFLANLAAQQTKTFEDRGSQASEMNPAEGVSVAAA